MQQYNNVTLSVNSTEVTSILFLMTISRHIKFGSTGKLDNIKTGHILNHFKALNGAYITRSLKVTIMLTDNQFEPMRGDLVDVQA